MTPPPSAGDAIAPGAQVSKVRVAELRQLFDAIDPSPFRERDLDPHAEQFIVEWARDLPRDAPLALRVHLERAAGPADEAPLLGQAMHQHFKARAAGARRTLRERRSWAKPVFSTASAECQSGSNTRRRRRTVPGGRTGRPVPTRKPTGSHQRQRPDSQWLETLAPCSAISRPDHRATPMSSGPGAAVPASCQAVTRRYPRIDASEQVGRTGLGAAAAGQ